MTFVQDIAELIALLERVEKENIDLKQKHRDSICSYAARKSEHYRSMVNLLIDRITKKSAELGQLTIFDPSNELMIKKILTLVNSLNGLKPQRMLAALKEIKQAYSKLEIPPIQKLASSLKNIPYEIREEIKADLLELEKCFASGCYRSSVIICGRLLEVALHRKYYETTGNDILEKNPGIGLGTLVAKLADKNVKIDPGLMQQIHLVNQVRIFSVHKKKQPFYPSRSQAQAIILYTLDVLKKLF